MVSGSLDGEQSCCLIHALIGDCRTNAIKAWKCAVPWKNNSRTLFKILKKLFWNQASGIPLSKRQTILICFFYVAVNSEFQSQDRTINVAFQLETLLIFCFSLVHKNTNLCPSGEWFWFQHITSANMVLTLCKFFTNRVKDPIHDHLFDDLIHILNSVINSLLFVCLFIKVKPDLIEKKDRTLTEENQELSTVRSKRTYLWIRTRKKVRKKWKQV